MSFEHALSCDRPSAREARRRVHEAVIPLAQAFGAQLSTACPLHPDNDHLLPHEGQKQPVTKFQWKCGVCGKMFKSEHYLDLHLERKHAGMLNQSASVCVGELCDVLQCPSWLSALQRQEKERPRPCRSSELEARRHHCQHMLHDCFEAARPGADLHPVFEAMEERFCRPLSCAGRKKLLVSGSSLAMPVPVGGVGGVGRGAYGTDGEGGGPGTVYYIFGGVLLSVLCLLYVSVGVHYSEIRSGATGELRSGGGGGVRRRRGGAWWQLTKRKDY
jgi:hypothetical protein